MKAYFCEKEKNSNYCIEGIVSFSEEKNYFKVIKLNSKRINQLEELNLLGVEREVGEWGYYVLLDIPKEKYELMNIHDSHLKKESFLNEKNN